MKKRIFEMDDDLNERVIAQGGPKEGSSIPFSLVQTWFNTIKSNKNAKFLKVFVPAGKRGVDIYNITDLAFTTGIAHSTQAGSQNYKFVVKICLADAPGSGEALSMAEAEKKFAAIVKLCETGIDTGNGQQVKVDPNSNEVQMFTCDKGGKLTRFSWVYDDDFDTAYIIRNWSKKQALDWLHGNGPEAKETMAEMTESPEKPSSNEIAELQAQILEYKKQLADKDARIADLETAIDGE